MFRANQGFLPMSQHRIWRSMAGIVEVLPSVDVDRPFRGRPLKRTSISSPACHILQISSRGVN